MKTDSPFDANIKAQAAKSGEIAIVQGRDNLPTNCEFRAHVPQDRIRWVNPDGSLAHHVDHRQINSASPTWRESSAYCKLTEDRTAIQIIFPAHDPWSTPEVVYARVADDAAVRRVLALHED